jgi:hypothetical protein
VTSSLPSAARAALEAGGLVYLGVPTTTGPHLTPLVYVLDGGRLWVTTSRRSVKARAWRRDGTVAGMVRGRDAFVVFRGQARLFDALDPQSWPATVASAPRLARAVTRFSLKNARFFAGYAVDARRVPLAWTPPGRVFAGIELLSGWVLSPSGGDVTTGWGDWQTGAGYAPSFVPLRARRAIDLRAPPTVRQAIGRSGNGAVALESDAGLTVLPVSWRRVPREGTYEALPPRRFLELTGASGEAAAALNAERASAWRATDMAGLLVQGRAQLFSLPETTRGRPSLLARLVDGGIDPSSADQYALIRIRPTRVVWWQGWTTGSAATRSVRKRR